MWNRSLKAVTIDLGFSYQGKDCVPVRIVFDSRVIQEGDLFVAIVGEKVDGHKFIDQARSQGAVGIVISDISYAPADDFPTVIAPSGEAFIEAYGRYSRDQFQGPVIAITGSQGKTSTKELLGAVLEHLGKKSVITYENQNNELGVPLTLARLTEETDYDVIEMGMTGLLEITHLCDIARPNYGIITNIGTVHAELLGSREAIARAKTELFQYLPKDGLCALRKEDQHLIGPFLSELKGKAEWCSLSAPDSSWYAEITKEEPEAIHFALKHHHQTWKSMLPVAGQHMLENALLVVAVAVALGFPVEEILQGLSHAKLKASHRMEQHRYEDGILIIDDAYNANPESMCATLKVLKGYSPRRTIAVLGDMYELGAYEKESFKKVGKEVARLGIDYLLCYGSLAQQIGHAAQREGMKADHIAYATSKEEAVAKMKNWLVKDTVVLLKGSHSLSLHTLISLVESKTDLKKLS